ncbi:hypothetical protein [Actinomycetospora aeridis]|uniref:Uncharacterized protein n=1 Tax=Actinomycetospora aeridis TaxID=3129231 RepID=A0ABU8N2D0_9PSEU
MSPTVHVSDAADAVTIEWPDRPGYVVVDREGHVDRHAFALPPFSRRLVDPAADEKPAEAQAVTR